MKYLKENLDKTIGKILFILSIILFLVLISLDINNYYIHIDEYYTVGLILLSLTDGIRFTAINVHPPLYYILLKTVAEVLTILNINYKTLFLLKMVSATPYVILLLLSLSKIRKDYGWLSAGLFSFAVLTISELSIFYLTLRMYSWGLLFLVLTFISLKEVLTKQDKKSWIFLTVFAILGAYTHYYVAIGSILIYLILLSYILFNKKDNKKSELKKWSISAIVGIMAYIPWISILLNQMQNVQSAYWIEPIGLSETIKLFAYNLTNSESLKIRIIAIIILLIFIFLSIKFYRTNKNNLKSKNKDYLYIIFGISVFMGSLLIGLILSFTFKPILIVRYLIPSLGVLWLSLSILMGKLYDYKKIFIPLLIVILIFGFSGISETINSEPMRTNEFLSEMNNNNTIVVFNNPILFIEYGHQLPNAEVYLVKLNNGKYDYNKWKYFLNKYDNYNSLNNEDFTEFASNNTNKTIYIIKNKAIKIPDTDNLNVEQIGSFSKKIIVYEIK